MIDPQEVLNNLEFTEEDKKNIKSLYPVIENYGYEIIDEVIKVLSKDPKVVNILEENNLSIPAARDAWMYWLKLLFSSEFNADLINRLSHIGRTHVDANVDETIVIQTTSLYLMKTLDKMASLALPDFQKLIYSVVKLFTFSLTIMVDSYREELIESFLEFSGMKKDLFNRQIKIQRKKRKEQQPK